MTPYIQSYADRAGKKDSERRVSFFQLSGLFGHLEIGAFVSGEDRCAHVFVWDARVSRILSFFARSKLAARVSSIGE